MIYNSVVRAILSLALVSTFPHNLHAQTTPTPIPTDGLLLAVGLEKVVSTYNGPAIRIQRASDNAQMDVSFAAGTTYIDKASVSDFLGSTTGWIVEAYDQSGNGNNALAPSNVANAPTISVSAPTSMVIGGATYLTARSNANGNDTPRYFCIPESVSVDKSSASAFLAFKPDFSGGQFQSLYEVGVTSGTTPQAFDLLESASGFLGLTDYTGGGSSPRFQTFNTALSADSLFSRSQPTVVGFATNPSVAPVIYLDGTAEATGGSIPTTAVVAGGHIMAGYSNPYGQPFVAFSNFLGFVLYNKTVSATDAATISSAMLPRIYPALSIVADGDSQTQGTGDVDGKNLTAYLEPYLSQPADIWNIALYGSESYSPENNVSGSSCPVCRLYNAYGHTYTTNIYYVLTGTNDLHGGVLATDLENRMEDTFSKAKALGFQTIGATILHEVGGQYGETADQGAQIDAFNTWLRSVVGSSYLDAIVDYQADSRLGTAAAFYPAYSDDGEHPNDAGYQVEASIAYPVFNAVAQPAASMTMSMSATSFSYSDQIVGTQSAAKTWTLTNTGGAAVAISSIALTGANPSAYVTSNNCGSSLAVGVSCNVLVSFNPQTIGTLTATVVVSDNAAGSSQSAYLSGAGISQPTMSISATSFYYSDQIVGTQSAAKTWTLTNTGNSKVAISSIGLTGANPSGYMASNNCGSSLAVGASCGVLVSFNPQAIGTLTADVVVSDNATGSPQLIYLSGAGITQPTMSISATAFYYNDQVVGLQSAAKTWTLTNTGSSRVTIKSIGLTGSNPSSYVLSNNCGGSLAAGTSCNALVSFNPQATGTLSADVLVTDNATGSPQLVYLSGSGITQPTLSISATAFYFSDQVVGTQSAARTWTLTNSGSSKVTISSIGLTGSNPSSYMSSNNCGSSLAVGTSCSVLVGFNPQTTTTLTADVLVTDNASGSPQLIYLSGSGITQPSMSISATALYYNSQTVGTQSAAKTLTLTNTGSSRVTISSIALTGANLSSYVTSNNCGSTLALGASCSVLVSFKPQATGTLSADVIVTSNVSGSPQGVYLSGGGS